MPFDSLKRRNVLFLFVLGTTTLAEAAAAAPERKRAKFVSLVDALGAGDEEIQDLLEKGELWTALHEKAVVKDKTIELGAFFDYCNRGMRTPEAISPVSPVATVSQGQ